MRNRILVVFVCLLLALEASAQHRNPERVLKDDYQSYNEAFEDAYRACPSVPRGLLEAVSFTNTHFRHLTDADYHEEEAWSMPRAYGLMGLVKDGKGYFRENLYLVESLSGISSERILQSPAAHVLAYAKACCALAEGEGVGDFFEAVMQLSELPAGEKTDEFPMHSMLYSICCFLNDETQARTCGFEKYDIDLQEVFGESLALLSSEGVRVASESDYPKAIWNPAPECNYGERSDPVSGVVVHYTEGSYAGCISWFKNCDAQVSAHYVIRSFDGQVTQMVREADKAWHARTANAYTIGIEHEAYGDVASYFTDAMYESSADLVRDICSRYDVIDGHRTFYRDTLDNGTCLSNGLHDLGGVESCVKIRGHQHYPGQSHTDPGPFWDWNYYYKLINKDKVEVQILTGEEGVLNHKDYGDDERRIWVIKGPEETTVSLCFKSFSLERDYDFLWIYDGDDVFAPQIGRWNSKSPGTVESSGNVMCIEFRSDCATSANGWEAEWKTMLPEPPEPELGYGVFPNPASEFVCVNVEGLGFYDVMVFDVCGRVVVPNIRFMNRVWVNVSSLREGVYYLRCSENKESVQVFKLVIVR